MRLRFRGAAALALLIIGLATGPADARILGKVAFEHRYAAMLKRLSPDATVEAASSTVLNVSRPGHDTMTAYLDNAYAEYLTDPDQLSDILKRYATVTLSDFDPANDTKPDNIVVLVRPQSALVSLANRPEDKRLVMRPFMGDLVEVIGVNEPTTFVYPTRVILQKAVPLSEAQLWAKAMSNTVALEGKVQTAALPGAPGIVLLECDNGLGTSLLLNDAVWARPDLRGRGAVVALVAKDGLIVGHAGDPGSIATLKVLLQSQAGDLQLLSDTLILRTKTGWVPYDKS